MRMMKYIYFFLSGGELLEWTLQLNLYNTNFNILICLRFVVFFWGGASENVYQYVEI